MNKGIRIQLLGIGLILLGLAVSTGDAWASLLGGAGYGIAVAGCFTKNKSE